MDSQTILTIIATGILFSGVLYGVYRSIKYDKNIAEQKNRIYVNKPSCNIKFNNNLKWIKIKFYKKFYLSYYKNQMRP